MHNKLSIKQATKYINTNKQNKQEGTHAAVQHDNQNNKTANIRKLEEQMQADIQTYTQTNNHTYRQK